GDRIRGVRGLVRLREGRADRDPGGVRVLDHDGGWALEFRGHPEGGVEVDQVVVREFPALGSRCGRGRGEPVRLPVGACLLIRILAVPEVGALVVRVAERRWERPTVPGGEVVEDRGIVAGRVLEPLEGQFLPQLRWDRLVVAPRLEHVAVAGRTHDHGDPRGVFRRRPDQGDPTDVDVLHGLVDRDVRLGYGRFERIQVHDDEIDRDRAQVLEVLLVDGRRENSSEDPGMPRLHATAESFAQARVVRDGGHGESRVLQDLRGPVCADQLKAEVPKAAGEIDQALLVRYAEERPRGRNHPYYRVPIGKRQLKVGTTGERNFANSWLSHRRLGTGHESGVLHQPRHDAVPAHGHQMDAADPVDFLQGLDR